jgi:GTPase SAR1 family protein
MINSNKIKLLIWDTAGQEKYFALTKNYFQKVDGVLIVFDVCDFESFKSKFSIKL